METQKSSKMDKFVEIASKLGGQIHLRSLRDAFATIMPLFILAGLAVMVNNVLFPWIADGDTLVTLQQFGNSITNGTLNIAGLLLCPAIAYFLSKNRLFENPISAALMALATLVVMMPLSVSVTSVSGDVEIVTSGILTFSNLGTSSMFAGIIIGLVETELLIFLSNRKKLKINLGEGVPPAVEKSFNVLIPSLISISLFAALALILDITLGKDLVTLIVTLIQEPLRGIGTSLPGYLFLYSLGNFLFTFGIHQSVINGSFTEPFMTQNITDNMLAFSNGTEPPHILTAPFQTAFAQMGGTGATISLLVAIFLFSKFRPYREIAKLAVAPGLFEINEPVIFGLPIVFNLPMMIPFVVLPALQTIIAYAATAAGMVSKTVVMVPWITPPIISGWLATGGDWRAPVLQVLLIALGVVVYLPFLKISERVSIQQAAELN
ncbi:PTS sugar transporter subunit IIC [Vagococcus elongatus]|uniref:Permease IIC component n=1 Tax=Vagococcus elongatus TaxID=180344 RepID=A0A430B1Z7_9ENTE|nr:PTS transporter subunit EIIC [Vagococcus elongatus]RSU14319.1 PTS cellobiose transporter subunit IIC [Vagococcus elongatus]